MKPLLLAAAASAALGSSFLAPAAWAQASMAESQVNALEGLAGPQPGSRRSGAKGICASGHFIGNAAGRELSRASVFKGDKIPVVARFSVGGGSPKASDKAKSVRGPVARRRAVANGQHLRAGVLREQTRAVRALCAGPHRRPGHRQGRP
ncbi:hypothetical protein [Hydrogenophaga sp.]|uniref:hypothetical protein n=1 Tax=Hydrogenophaga sp. TaxID=1904254 RepID=UPI003AF6F953